MPHAMFTSIANADHSAHRLHNEHGSPFSNTAVVGNDRVQASQLQQDPRAAARYAGSGAFALALRDKAALAPASANLVAPEMDSAHGAERLRSAEPQLDPDSCEVDRYSLVATNHLLQNLPEDELLRIRSRMTRVTFAARQYVYASGDRLTGAIFPESGWLSNIATLRDGDCSDAGLVGRDGMVGIPLLLGDDRSICDVMAHAPCTALRMTASSLKATLEDCPTLRSRLQRYALVAHAEALQLAACNAHHVVGQRFARSLLVADDCAGGVPFMMTHELLAVMLGVRRAGVTVAAGALQREGLIRYSKGLIEIRDRPRMMQSACECYATLRATRARILPPPSPPAVGNSLLMPDAGATPASKFPA